MAKMNGKKGEMQRMIAESMRELGEGRFPEDPRIDENEISGPARFEKTQKTRDESLIDALWSDLAGKQGYFVKLKKEIPGRPNEWMIMKIIENDWRKWADIETAVTELVIENTRVAPNKWGTGQYRVEMTCRGGQRGQGYDPINVFVNALEEESHTIGQSNKNENEKVGLLEQIDTVSQLVNTLGGILKPQDPAMIQNQIAEALKTGLQLKMNEGSNSIAMMQTMMQSMMGVVTALIQSNNKGETSRQQDRQPEETLGKMLEVMKSMGVIGQQKAEKTTLDFVKELKEIGFEPFKERDPLDQFDKMKKLIDVTTKFIGTKEGEVAVKEPGMFQQIIEALGPAIPAILEYMKSQQQMHPVQVVQNPPAALPQQPMQPMQPMRGEAASNNIEMDGEMQAKLFFDRLYEAVKKNDKNFYSTIVGTLGASEDGVKLVGGIITGETTEANLITVLQMYGGDRFKDSEFVMKSLVGYVKGFMQWVKMAHAQNQQRENGQVSEPKEAKSPVDAICPVCKTEYEYDSLQAFMEEEDKRCEQMPCPGMIELQKKVSNA